MHVVTCTPVSFAAVTSADGSADGDADGGFGGLAKLTAEQVPASTTPGPADGDGANTTKEDGVDAGLIVGIVIVVLLLVGIVLLAILVSSRSRKAAAAAPPATSIALQGTGERTSDRRGASSRRRSRQPSRRASQGTFDRPVLSSTRLESNRT